MEESRRLVVCGFVQGVGYRAFVKQAAYRFRIKGTVQNLRDGSVEIYARAEPEALVRFKEFLMLQSPGDVENIEEYPEGSEAYGNGPDDWIGFNILRDDYSSLEETMEYVVLGGVRLEKEMKAGFADLKGEMRTGFADLKGEIKLTREELGEKIDASNEKTENFHMEMVQKFDALDVKYGVIGQGLNEMIERFDRLEGDVKEMKDAFLRLVNHMTKE